MSISVQSSTAALIALENLANANLAGAAAQTQTSSQTTAAASDQPATVIDASAAGAAAAQAGVDAGLGAAASAVDAAVSAGGTIGDLLAQMRQAALGASDPSLGADARGALNSRFRSDLAKINAVVAQASSGGVNLIDGSVSGSLQAPAGGGSTVTLTGANLSVGGPLIGLTDDASLADPAQAASAAATLETAIGAVGQAVSQLSVQSQAIDGHLSVLAQASLTASPGVAAAVNPNLDEDGARLQALQVLQQLQAGGGAATSQAPQSILALFR